jgi:hypothetical protein
MGRLSAEQVRAWVDRTCHEQRVPVAVTNPSTLSRIGVLMGQGRDAPQPEAAPRRGPSYSLQMGSTRSGSNRLGPAAV